MRTKNFLLTMTHQGYPLSAKRNDFRKKRLLVMINLFAWLLFFLERPISAYTLLVNFMIRRKLFLVAYQVLIGGLSIMPCGWPTPSRPVGHLGVATLWQSQLEVISNVMFGDCQPDCGIHLSLILFGQACRICQVSF